MIAIGLTGGVGSGKSTVAEILAGSGVSLLDTDQVARDLVAPGQPALAELHRVFGPGIFAPTGELDRRALAGLVFSQPAARQQLEAILHPHIREVWRQQLRDWRALDIRLGAVVIPLLFEIGAAADFDVTVCVGCSRAVQGERLRARGWSAAEIEGRLAAQMPLDAKLAAARYVIWNDGTREALAAQVARVVAAVCQR